MNKKLQAKIAQLEKQNSQLKASFYEIINLAYEAVNKSQSKEPNFSFFGSGCSKCSKNHPANETLQECFFNWIKDFTQAKNQKNNQAHECSFSFDNFKDFFTKKPQEAHD